MVAEKTAATAVYKREVILPFEIAYNKLQTVL